MQQIDPKAFYKDLRITAKKQMDTIRDMIIQTYSEIGAASKDGIDHGWAGAKSLIERTGRNPQTGKEI